MLHERTSFVNRTFKYLFEYFLNPCGSLTSRAHPERRHHRVRALPHVAYRRARGRNVLLLHARQRPALCRLPAVCGFRAGACEGGAQHRRIRGGHGQPDFCIDAAVALLHVARPARSGAGGQQPAHHLREILRAGGENAAARLAAVQPRACGRPAHRGVLPAARARGGSALRAGVNEAAKTIEPNGKFYEKAFRNCGYKFK